MTSIGSAKHARSAPDPVRYERVAVAIDPSPTSEDALALAAALVPGADLLMLSVEPELERMLLPPANIRAARRSSPRLRATRSDGSERRARRATAANDSRAIGRDRVRGRTPRGPRAR